MLGVAPSSAYELMHEADFPVLKVGNRMVVPKDGRWEGRYTAGYDPDTGKRIIKNVLGKTQAETKAKLDRFIGKVKKYLDLDELTPAVLNDMVKAVYVHAPDKSSGHREQQIDISYDLVGILPASLLYDLHNEETA